MTKLRTAARLSTLPAAAFLSLGLVAPAAAHVSAAPSTTVAGEYAVLTFSVSHGCEGSATTKIEIQLPEEILSVTPTRHPLWSVSTTTVALDKPVTDAHGNTVSSRMGSVIFTAATPLPADQRDSFALSLKLPDKPGTLAFPTVQTCEEGQTSWSEVADDPKPLEELEYPAPLVVVTKDAPKSTDAHESSTGVATAGLAAGILGAVIGGTALVQVRRRP